LGVVITYQQRALVDALKANTTPANVDFNLKYRIGVRGAATPTMLSELDLTGDDGIAAIVEDLAGNMTILNGVEHSGARAITDAVRNRSLGSIRSVPSF
jgi:hypothetical protein